MTRVQPTFQTSSTVENASVVKAGMPEWHKESTTMSLYHHDHVDLSEELEKLYAAAGGHDEALEEQLVARHGALDLELPYYAMDATKREDLRAFAAKIWVRSLYPSPCEDVREASRRQTAYTLPALLAELIVELVVHSPTLVKLGVLEGLDDVADFRLMRALLERDGDAILRAEAVEMLQEEGG